MDCLLFITCLKLGFPGGSNSKDSGDQGSIPGSGKPPGEGNGYPLQYSCLENSIDRRAWWATIHRITKSLTRLKWLSTHACAGQNPHVTLFTNPRLFYHVFYSIIIKFLHWKMHLKQNIQIIRNPDITFSILRQSLVVENNQLSFIS